MRYVPLVLALALGLVGCEKETEHRAPGTALRALQSAPQTEQFQRIIIDMSVIPLKITSSGVLTTARVEPWPTSNVAEGTFTANNRDVVENLRRRECDITLQVVQRDQTGLFYNTETPMVLSCLNRQGARTSIELHGTLTDSAARTGATSNDVGDNVYFLVRGGGAI